MGQRLARSRRTGDDGSTGLGDGTRTRKDTLRAHAMGDVNELNSSLGVLLAEPLPDDVRARLVVIQHDVALQSAGQGWMLTTRTRRHTRQRVTYGFPQGLSLRAAA